MNKFEEALFIGRFEPLHNGHVWEMEQALNLAQKLIVGIGSSNVRNTDNPFPAELRRQMLEKVIEARGWKKRIETVEEIPDTPDDAAWVAKVDGIIARAQLTPAQVVVIGNNDWVNGLLARGGYAVRETGFHERETLEGTKIRAMMRGGDPGWKQRVPTEVAEMAASGALPDLRVADPEK